MKRVGFFRSIHIKFVVIYVLLILVAMEVIGVYFTDRLEARLVSNFKESVQEKISLLAFNVEEEILKERGIRQDIIDAVKFMTHDPSMSYFDYICTIETHPIARIVKICDLENNMDVRRLKSMSDGDLRRIRRYWAAWKYLKGEIGKTKAKNLMERK